jgi:hypothetical protein
MHAGQHVNPTENERGIIMGLLLPTFRRRVVAEINGKNQSSLETVSAVKEGKLLRITEGGDKRSRVDGSEYVVAHVQVKPGTAIRVAGYGAEQIAAIRNIPVGGDFNAILTPMTRDAYKLVEFEAPSAQSGEQSAA